MPCLSISVANECGCQRDATHVWCKTVVFTELSTQYSLIDQRVNRAKWFIQNYTPFIFCSGLSKSFLGRLQNKIKWIILQYLNKSCGKESRISKKTNCLTVSWTRQICGGIEGKISWLIAKMRWIYRKGRCSMDHNKKEKQHGTSSRWCKNLSAGLLLAYQQEHRN